MRRPVAALLTWLSLVALLVALVPSTVQATAPLRTRDQSTSLDCFATTDDGVLFATVSTSTAFEPFLDLAFWAAPAEPELDPPTYVATGGTATSTATSLRATFELAEFDPESDPPFGDVLPPAVLTATLSPLGDPFPYEDRFRDGNRFARETGTIQPLLAEGRLTLPGDDLTDFSSCFAQAVRSSFFGSNPAAFRASFSDFGLGCFWETETGEVEVSISGTPGGFASIDVFALDGDREFGGSDEATLTRSAFSGEVTLVDFIDGSEVGSASAVGTLTQDGATIRPVDRNGREWVKAVLTFYTVNGTFDIDIDGQTMRLPMDVEHCFGLDQRVREHRVAPAGPKPRPYPNETPATATPAVIGGKVIKLTTGAGALEAEASCLLDDEFDVPIGHTAWWSVVGNGRDITVDTRGSDFDTVVAVYVRNGGNLVQVDCVDDNSDGSLSDLQARLTWPSTAGTTYLIQIGGFGGSTGHLQVTIR